MQQAIPYKSWQLPRYTNTTIPRSTPSISNTNPIHGKRIKKEASMYDVASENAVVIFSKEGCCMSHVMRRLLLGLGVNPPVYEVGEEDEVGCLEDLEKINNCNKEGGKIQLPAVFIGGRLFGGLDRVMATHISGELIPILKDARALWL